MANQTLFLEAGRIVAGRFVILSCLGDRVFLAYDKCSMRKVVVRQTGGVVGTVRHPNVCQIFESFAHSGERLCSTEYVEGRTLEETLERGSLDPQRAKSLGKQIAEGMCALHRAGILHGDLTPGNIMVEGFGKGERAVVMNAGRNQHHASVRADIFAFGQLMEAMLSGTRVALDCMATHACDRPDSFELVLEELQECDAPRTWIGSLLIAASMAGLLYQSWQPHAGRTLSHELTTPDVQVQADAR